jgi:signal transduction histidine kinase
MDNIPATRRTNGGDAVVAALAGPLAWDTSDRSPTLVESATVRAAIAAQAGLLITIAGLAVHHDGATSASSVAVAAAACCAGAIGVTGAQTWCLATHRAVALPTMVFVSVRLAGLVAFAIGWTVLAPGPLTVLIWPLGVYIGTETAITEMIIEHPHPVQAGIIEVLTSPVHTGLLAGFVGAAVIGRGSAVEIAIEAVVAIETLIVSGVATRAAINRLSYAEQERTDRVRAEERSIERHRRAHWIHDEVCADLRSVKLQLASGPMTAAQIDAELDELDHRLRLRQLDEIIAGGDVTAAELIQPYLRRAQSAGVALVDVPRYEEASVKMPARQAEILRRAVAGLVNNALAAGTTTLAIRLSHGTGDIAVTVEDDAGGFDLSAVPAGRGLSALADEVGSDNVRVTRSPTGAIVEVRIPWNDRT